MNALHLAPLHLYLLSLSLSPSLSLSLSLSLSPHSSDGTPKRTAKLVRILRPEVDADFEVGPALFGPDLGENEFQVSAELVEPKPLDGCSAYSDEETEELKGKIFLITRGSCLFVQKVNCLLYTSPSPRDATLSRMPSSA